MAEWLSKKLGAIYAELYRRFGPDTFTSEDVAEISGSEAGGRVALLRMRKAGTVYIHEKRPKKWLYRLAEPDTYLLSVSKMIKNLEKIPQQRYSRLIGVFCTEVLRAGIGLKSVVLFGSVARGNAKPDSDVDLLIVSDAFKSLGEAIDRLVEVEYSQRVSRELEWLENNGISTHLSFHPMNTHTLQKHPPIILDIVEEGIAVIDDGTFEREAEKVRTRMKGLGARRIWLTGDEWVWILKPDAKIGEVIEI